MKKENSIILFHQKQVRRHWDEELELWYFSVVDVVAILTDSVNPQAYWRKLKERLKKEGNETVTNCHGLKMLAADKMTVLGLVSRVEDKVIENRDQMLKKGGTHGIRCTR